MIWKKFKSDIGHCYGMDVSFSVSQKDMDLIQKYAESHNMTVPEAFMSAIREALEDEADAEYCDRIIRRNGVNPRTRSLEDINAEYDSF